MAKVKKSYIFKVNGKLVKISREKFSDKILCILGTQDVILDTIYNDEFCRKNNITNIYLDASHSLFEEISKAFKYTIDFFNEK